VTAPTGSDQIVVDSSGWLEFFTADTKADLFDPYLRSTDTSILVPAIVLYEVRKILLLRQTKLAADYFVSEALRHTVVPITQEIALSAAAISIQYKLAMADALVYSTAERFGARLVTSDTGFRDLPGVILL
jgi:predicted nucleic acid-binding protein